MMSRREFLIAAAGATAAMTGGSAERLDRIGVQLFSLPKLLEQDFPGTLKMLAGLGYREIELFGPYPFSVPAAQEGWKALAPMLGFSGSGYFGRTPQEVRRLLDANGLTAPSMHVDLDTLRTRLDQVGEAAHVLGHRYCGIAAIPPEERRTLDDYRRRADELNAIGARAAAMGFQVLYHNHGYGLSPMEGKIPLHVLLERIDPKVVAMEMDLYWTVAGGGDPVAMFDAYPGRYRLMHVKDMAKRVRFAGDGNDQSQWMALFPFMATAGSGVLELPRILAHAKKAGVQHFHVEQDLVANPPEALGASIRYLRGMELVG